MAFYDEVEGTKEEVQEEVNEVDNRDIHTLSTGIRVYFTGRIPENISQSMVTQIFNKTQLDSNGAIRANLSSREQIEVASTLLNFNTGLIFSGKVRLADGLPEDNSWLDEIVMNPVILDSHKNIDLNNPLHLEKLYLRYFAFSSSEDFELLSNKLIGGNN